MEEKCEFYSEKIIYFFKHSRWPTASLVWSFTARHVSMSRPPHARLETQAPRATPQPKPTRGGGLGVFPQPTPQPKLHTP
ncbi:hypothetical protein Hanom_Chr16g01483661 [Helianthus anomalus]